MAWPVGMPLVTITQDVHKLPDGSLPSSYSVHLQLSVPALVFDGVTTLIRRSITLTAEAGSGVISEQVPHLNHPDLSPTPVYYMVTEFADGNRVRDPWQLTPAADDVTIDLDAAAPIAGDPGTPVAVGPQGPQGIQGEVGPQGPQGIQGEVGPSGTLSDVSDGALTSPQTGDAPVFDEATGKWEKVSLSSTYATKAELANVSVGSVGVVFDDTPAAPAEGTSATYFVTSAVSWPAGLVWSSDPDGDTPPTIIGTALVSMFTIDGTTRAVLGATFPTTTSVPVDVTAPTAGTLMASGTNTTGFYLLVEGATDDGGLHATPYRFSLDNGDTWSDWQASELFVVSDKAPGTSFTCKHQVRDAAENTSTGTAITASTAAAGTAPQWTATFTMGTPTATTVTATASALATDNVAVTGYEVSYDGGTTWSVITPSGSVFTLTGANGTTYSTTKLRAKDADGNYSSALSVPSYTLTVMEGPTVTYRGASSNVPIGDESPDRTVLVAVSLWGSNGLYSPWPAPTTMTINGVVATRDFADAPGNNANTHALFRAVVPTGTTLAITGMNNGTDQVHYTVWTANKPVSVVDSAISGGTNYSVTVDTALDSFVIANCAGDFGAGVAWGAGVTERLDMLFHTAADGTTDGTAKTISVNAYSSRMYAVSYQAAT